VPSVFLELVAGFCRHSASELHVLVGDKSSASIASICSRAARFVTCYPCVQPQVAAVCALMDSIQAGYQGSAEAHEFRGLFQFGTEVQNRRALDRSRVPW